MTRAMEFDLCEIALTTHAQARAYGKPITALPVVLLSGLHHGALICRQRLAAAWPVRPGGQAYRRARLVADHRRMGARHPAGRVRHRAGPDDLWSTGTGSELMRRIAAPMVGGMISSAVLTLLVIPAIYALVKGWEATGLQGCCRERAADYGHGQPISMTHRRDRHNIRVRSTIE